MIVRRRRIAIRASRALLLAGLWLALVSGAQAASPHVVVLTATGVVDNVMAGYLEEGIRNAGADGASAVVVQLNTPGGALDATQRITSALLEAPIPTIVWVAPSGGRAASAGTFITLAAHLAYMAHGTNIGAASPVDSSGQDIPGTLGEKVKNDAIANITSIAEARGRNVAWAVSTVQDAKSYPASAAVAAGAVNGIADTIDDVLAQANGQTVTVKGVPTTVAVEGATIDDQAMNPFQGLLHLLSDPNIAFVLFTIGVYGLIFEVMNPNFVTGILGAISILLAFIGFGSLPLNVAGLLLIGFGIILFALETHVTSHGLLAVAGIVCFVLGASALYTAPGGDPTEPLVQVAPPLILTTTVTLSILMGLIVWVAIRTREMPAPKATVGVPIPIGTEGVVQVPLAPAGTVQLAGESWSARLASEGELERGTSVRLVGFDGLTAVVEPAGDAPSLFPSPARGAGQPPASTPEPAPGPPITHAPYPADRT